MNNSSSDDFINLDFFERQEKINKGKDWKSFEILNLKNGKKCLVKISNKSAEDLNKKQITCFSREINMMSRINYPSIPKFFGYILTDFKGKSKPGIIMEFVSKFSLDNILSEDKDIQDSELISKFNDTKKLINIYGIASAMSYLHSHNVIHRGFKLKQIFLDDNLYPKLAGFNHSIELPRDSFKNSQPYFSTARGSKQYLSPEILSRLEYSKSSDVYEFAIVMCEIMNGETSFNKTDIYCPLSHFVSKVLERGERPQIKESVPECYRNLIQRCWAQNPGDRPAFEDIVNELKSNHEFVTADVDAEEFHKYVQFLEESEKNFTSTKIDRIQHFHINL